ncbi:MAG: hypothetical protein E6H81_09725 [Chloroflexi bacterium]|nr:MAG: hypothetical protein E6H81_09725 [Chloroflexota bacterium]
MGRVVAAFVVLALILPPPRPAAASAMPQAPNCPIYPSDDVWHSNIQLMPVHPMSDTWIANMGGPSRLIHPDLGAYPYGYQLQVVDNTTLTTRLSFGYADESDDVPYPFTSTTPIEPASDAHAFMLNKDTCVLYELFDASWNGGRPTAGSGAVFDLKSHALRPAGWTSADAAGLPIWPGVLRYDEVARGLVDHAIRFTAERTDRSYVWPARHQAGAASDPSLPPMGARFRLKSDFGFTGFSPQTQVVLMAMQRYGLILADNGSNFFFQGETSSQWSDQLISELKRIPAGAFEAVDASSLMVDPNSGQVPAASMNQALIAGWHSTWQQQSPYLVMAPGQVADFWIRFSNSGTETWVRGVWGRQANLGLNGDDKIPYRLGMASNWLWDDRVATTTAASVAPGEIGEFRFQVRAPLSPGTYTLNLRPVIDGTVWMEDQGVFWLIVVR